MPVLVIRYGLFTFDGRLYPAGNKEYVGGE